MNKKFTMATAVVASVSMFGKTVLAEETPTVNTPEATTEAVEVAKTNVTETDVAKSKENVALVDGEVTSQEGVVKSVQTEVSTATEGVSTAKGTVEDTKKLADEATSENITKAEGAVETAKDNVALQEEKLKETETQTTAAENKVSEQEGVVKDAQTELASAKQETAEAKKSVDEAQAILDGTGQAEIVKAVETAKDAVEADKKTLADAQDSLEKAKEADAKRQSDIAEAEGEVTSAQNEVVSTKKSLDDAAAEADKTASSLKSVTEDVASKTATVSGLENEIANANTLTLPSGYVDALKAYKANKTADKSAILEGLGKDVLANNTYKSNAADEAEVVADVNNLTQEQREKITVFTVDLLNPVRKLFGSDEMVVNNSAIQFADRVATAYKDATWNSFSGGHYVEGINNAATSVGLETTARNSYEDLSTLVSPDDEIVPKTMADVKKRIYESVVSMFGEDGNSSWGHAISLAGLLSDNVYIGVDLSSYNVKFGAYDSAAVMVHLLSVYNDQITDNTKFDIVDSQPSRDLQAELTVAKANLDRAKEVLTAVTAENEKAQASKVEAQSNYDKAVQTLAAANQTLAEKTAVPLLTPNAETKLADAEAKLAKDKEVLAKAEEALANLTADIKVKQANLEAAKKVLAEKQANQEAKEANLSTEQAKLEQLQAEFANAEKAVVEEKAALESARKAVDTAQNYLDSLKNAPELYAKSKEALSIAEAKLADAEAVLKAEKVKLDELKAKQADVHADHKKLVDAYNAFLKAKAEAVLKAKLAKQMEDIKAKGGVPVVDEKGNVTEYVDGSIKVAQTASKTVVAPLATSTSWAKKTLPQTGDTSSILGVVGMAMAGILAGAFPIRKRKK